MDLFGQGLLDRATGGTLLADDLTSEDVMDLFGQGLLDRATGGANLDENAPLSAPEWTIDVDHDAGEAMIAGLEAEGE